MNKKQAKNLFNRYIRNECSPQEVDLLHNYLDSFQDKTQLWQELNYDEEIKEKLWNKIKSEIEIKKKPAILWDRKYFRYAAIFIGLLGGFWLYQSSDDKVQENELLVIENAITLKSSDNEVREINTENEETVLDINGRIVGKQNGNQIKYDNNVEITQLIYNEVIVPNGKKFQIILSDGTLVHINSGSSFKYPVNFIPEQERQVFLKGEAYFEVTKDGKNPFFVSTESMGINVLGTHFNVNTYTDSETYTVLAEGSVAVYNKKSSDLNPTIIQPGEKAFIAESSIEVTAVDVNDYLGWREDMLSFNNQSFKEIIYKIERHYGVLIQNDVTALNSERFYGNFKSETIIDLMDTFKESAGFDYSIENNKIKIYNMKK
jgi:hypothetical protein